MYIYLLKCLSYGTYNKSVFIKIQTFAPKKIYICGCICMCIYVCVKFDNKTKVVIFDIYSRHQNHRSRKQTGIGSKNVIVSRFLSFGPIIIIHKKNKYR